MKKSDISGATVAVQGLAELQKCFRLMDKSARKEAKEKLKSVGRIVATEAQSIARAKGLVDEGQLVRKIKPKALARAILIEASAVRQSNKYPDGYSYPTRYEYEKNRARAFMRPALERKQSEVIERFEEIFDELERIWEAKSVKG